MDFKKAAILGSCLSKDYAEDLFRLLVTYRSISASEAASRLDLHIKTVQDFLEDIFLLDILYKEEVYEGKRPYFRYSLKVSKISFEIDLGIIPQKEEITDSRLNIRIREKNNSGARFTTSRSSDSFSNVTIWIGEGRNRTERKINLSSPQGRFLFHLPFPSAVPLSIITVIKKAGVEAANIPEIIDIVDVLVQFGVIESII